MSLAPPDAQASQQPSTAADAGFGAFISYSGEANRHVVDRLQNRIERLAKPWYRTPIVKVFVDQTSLGAGSRLWSRIEKGLSKSSWLILVASPEAAGSWWVERELQWWLANRSLENLIIVHTAGTLAWDRDRKDFAADSTAIPTCLRGRFDDEPVWETVSREDPGTAIEKATLSIAAAIRQMPIHELSSVAFKEHRRTLRWARGAIAVLSVLLVTAIVAAVVAVVQFNRAAQESNRATQESLRATMRYHEATALRLVTEAEAMLADNQSGTDAQAFKQILAARAIAPSFQIDGALYTAAAARVNTGGIVEMPYPVYSLAVNPDRTTLATGSADGTIRLFDISGVTRVTATMKAHTTSVWSLAFSPDGEILAAASDDKTVSLWNAHTGAFIDRLTGHAAAVRSVTFSPDGSQIATASFDKKIGIWDVRNHSTFLSPRTPYKRHLLVAFSPDGHTLASGGDDTTVRLWDTKTRDQIGEPLTPGHSARVRSVAFSSDGERLVSGSRDETVVEWNIKDRKRIGDQPLKGPEGSIYQALYSPDGKRIVASSRDGTIWVWNAITHERVGDPLQGHDGVVNSVAFIGSNLLVSCSNDKTIRFWRMLDGQPTVVHDKAVRAVAYSPVDHGLIATAGDDGAVKLWNVSEDKLSPRPGPVGSSDKPMRSVAFSPQGERIAAAGDDMTIRIWDIRGGPPVVSDDSRRHKKKVNSVAFSPDGRFVVSGSDDRSIKMWNSYTGELVADFKPDPVDPTMGRVYTVAFSSDGRLVASGGDDKYVRLWNPEAGAPASEPLSGHLDPVWVVAFSPDDRTIASGGSDNTVRFWDTHTHRPVGRTLIQRDVVWALAFNRHGDELATADGDNLVRVWDLHSYEQIGTQLVGHTGAVYGVAFNPTEPQLASVSDDHQLRLWPTTAQPEDLCKKLTTDINQDQWRDWVAPDIDYKSVCPKLPLSLGV